MFCDAICPKLISSPLLCLGDGSAPDHLVVTSDQSVRHRQSSDNDQMATFSTIVV
jgi:hypothetical protein